MKRGLLILVVSLAAGILTFYIARTQQVARHSDVLLDSMPELTWLRNDLKLSDDQFTKASELHSAYRPVCAEMCANIAAAHTTLESLARNNRKMTPELEQAIRDHARVHAECQRKMLQHLYKTADLFDETQATRYLETMIPHTLDFTAGYSSPCPLH